MAAPKNGAKNCGIMIDSVWLRLYKDQKTVTSGDWSFWNNLEKFDNPPFRYF